MKKKKILVCFDFEKDRHYKFLMDAWNENEDFELNFADVTPSEIKSDNISVIKANLTKKINEADVTLVLIGKDANKAHPDREQIGYRNWQVFEIERSKENGNSLIAVKLDTANESPDAILGCGATWVKSFNKEDIVAAINEA